MSENVREMKFEEEYEILKCEAERNGDKCEK